MRHIRTFFLPAALATATACAAPAAEQKPAAQPPAAAPQAVASQAAKPKASDDMMICRYERETGSNIAQKVCRPKNPSQVSDDSAREWLREQQNHNAQSARPGG